MNTIKTWEQLLNERIGDGQITTNDDVRIAMLDHIEALSEALKVAQAENADLLEISNFFNTRATSLANDNEELRKQMSALQAKLSAIEKQEPVGYVGCDDHAKHPNIGSIASLYEPIASGAKLYAAPVAPAQPVSAEVCHPAKVTSNAIGGGTALVNLSGGQPVNELVEALQDLWDASEGYSDKEIAARLKARRALANAKAAQPEGDAERQERDVAHAHALFFNLKLHGEHAALKAAFSSLWSSAFSHGFQVAKKIYSTKAERYDYLMDYRVHQIAPMFGVPFGNYTPELETINLVSNAIDAARKGNL